MILVLGGTTEGRKAVEVLEEAAQPYFYSTKGEVQQVASPHGTRITGALDAASMLAFCKEHGIRLLVDAAHPFAENLHCTVADVSGELDIPVVRYERQYPPRDNDLVWCNDYQDAMQQMEAAGVDRLLALTGVQTIGKLAPFWQKHLCWFRVLDREESLQLAVKQGFPAERVLFYQPGGDEGEVLNQLHPQAIITKESGASGGFNEKIEAARQAGVKVFVVKRPELSPDFRLVDGPHGLRRTVEQLLPGFYPLRTGYTTGSCATAASVAALKKWLGEAVAHVSIFLPDGESISIQAEARLLSDHSAMGCVVKDAGDDPDITSGTEIWSTVEYRPSAGKLEIGIQGGQGVGRVTLPGLGLEVGGAAINQTPRRMIEENLRYHLRQRGITTGTITVTIAVPQGEKLAKKTFNPRLGIEGGISIIGTSGIVKPFSSEAFVNSIRKQVEMVQALKVERLVINSGAKSEKYVRKLYPHLPSQAFVHYGNFIGETIRVAHEVGLPRVTMGIMIGKAVKLAEGSLDTHSKHSTMNKLFLQDMAQQAGCSADAVAAIDSITLARELWSLFHADDHKRFFTLLLQACHLHADVLLPQGELTILLLTEEGDVY